MTASTCNTEIFVRYCHGNGATGDLHVRAAAGLHDPCFAAHGTAFWGVAAMQRCSLVLYVLQRRGNGRHKYRAMWHITPPGNGACRPYQRRSIAWSGTSDDLPSSRQPQSIQ